MEEARTESSRFFQALLSALEDKTPEDAKDEREPGMGDGEWASWCSSQRQGI